MINLYVFGNLFKMMEMIVKIYPVKMMLRWLFIKQPYCRHAATTTTKMYVNFLKIEISQVLLLLPENPYPLQLLPLMKFCDLKKKISLPLLYPLFLYRCVWFISVQLPGKLILYCSKYNNPFLKRRILLYREKGKFIIPASHIQFD